MLRFYLDSSAILKRYLIEPGTECVDAIYDKAETGDLVITISLWNIGEVLGVFDQKRRQGLLPENGFEELMRKFGDELLKLIRLKSIEIIPAESQLLTDTWSLLKRYHLYEADALQIATCAKSKDDALISSDEALVKASRKEGLNAICLPKDENELKALLNS